MKIKLLSFTHKAEKMCAIAAGLCYSSVSIEKVSKKFLENNEVKKILKKVISAGHYSVLEHVSFTFGVEGVSRSLLAQFTRHRIASFSVQSQRYVRFRDSIEFIIPETIKKNKLLLKKYNSTLESVESLYKGLLDAGISAEDARYILPNASPTKLMVTMNARELRHFFSLRCCNKSQKEIRYVACCMLNFAKKKAPLLFCNAGPECVRGDCREASSCGSPWGKVLIESL
ncbi:MAG: FAD-dependent thymidylate synthase [Endomicrobium sp.]|jgi:thymidylate synthase (FAD)|nr:FAD-dependent thymidylate synthase [Endomicrobium sp.]